MSVAKEIELKDRFENMGAQLVKDVAKDQDGIKVSLSEVAGSQYKAYQGVTTIKEQR